MVIDISQHQFRSALFKSVVEQAIQFFVKTPIYPLPPDEMFAGAGVYALYLLKHDSIYQYIASEDRPIYVGKAVPPGWRIARSSYKLSSTALRHRLAEHAKSISYASDLLVSDFRCRFMVLDGAESDLIAPVESGLIRYFEPLWNSVIDGFGNHTPGTGRFKQKWSEWDALHPGRPWTTKLETERPNIDTIIEKIKRNNSKSKT